MTTTYTHIGRHRETRSSTSRGPYKHGLPPSFRTHALTRSGAGYVALCGTYVPATYQDRFEFTYPNPITTVAEGDRVTCKKCVVAIAKAVRRQPENRS